MQKLSMRLVSSEPIGSTPPSIATRRAGHDVGATTSKNLPALGNGDVAETAAAIESRLEASLTLRSNSSLSWRTTGEFEKVGARINCIEDLTDTEIETNLRLVREASPRSQPRDIIQALTKCDIVTKARDAGDQELKGRMAVFVEDLSEFSPDAVDAAFAKHRRMEKWRPTVSEIRDGCQKEMRLRLSLHRQLDREAKRRRLAL